MPVAALLSHQQNIAALTFSPLVPFRTTVVDQVEGAGGHVVDQVEGASGHLVDQKNDTTSRHIANQD